MTARTALDAMVRRLAIALTWNAESNDPLQTGLLDPLVPDGFDPHALEDELAGVTPEQAAAEASGR